MSKNNKLWEVISCNSSRLKIVKTFVTLVFDDKFNYFAYYHITVF